MRYYIEDKSQPKGFVEVSKAEYKALFGDDVTRPYVQAVYRGGLEIEDVPDEHREVVQAIVANRADRWGQHDEDTEATEADYLTALERFGVHD